MGITNDYVTLPFHNARQIKDLYLGQLRGH